MRRRIRAAWCPTCGRLAMLPAVRAISTHAGDRKVRVAGVRLEECTSCGERLYDLAALRRLAAARTGTRRGHAA